MSNKIKFIILFVSLTIVMSCGRDDEKIIIKDFSSSKEIVLKPYKGYPYAMMNIWIKGYVNDTILIKLHSIESEPIMKLKGDIDERWYTDYYGEGERIIIFEPYKATEGELEIKAQL